MNQSMKPYLIRGLYEWCADEGLTPHIGVWVNEYTQVPMQFVKDEQIVLNISYTACQNIKIDNDWISFSARFSGKVEEIFIPVGHVLSFFARETGEGMGFELEVYEGETENEIVEPEKQPEKPVTEPLKTSHLKLVK